jgi:non-specific serine/threonine protein kinase
MAQIINRRELDMTRQETQKLNAYFLPKGFVIDNMPNQQMDTLKTWIAAFEADKYSALFHLGFFKKEKWFSPSIEYLYHIAEMLIKKLSQQSEIEFNRDAIQVDLLEDEFYHLKDELPFVIGMEYVDDDWIRTVWEALLAVFKLEIKNYDGTVARYFTEHNANINVVGRVFFHLVENKEEQYPFAFMATYSTKPVKSKRAVHTPLKNALEEFDGDEKKLLALISTVIKAAEKSSFISELLESGELFSPLKLTAEEAYTVLT